MGWPVASEIKVERMKSFFSLATIWFVCFIVQYNTDLKYAY